MGIYPDYIRDTSPSLLSANAGIQIYVFRCDWSGEPVLKMCTFLKNVVLGADIMIFNVLGAEIMVFEVFRRGNQIFDVFGRGNHDF